MAGGKPPLHERANTYLFLTAALGAIGVLPYLIGQVEVTNHHPWHNGWIRLATVIWVLAVAALLWGFGLYVFNMLRTRRRRRARQRKAEADRQQKESQRLVLDATRERERERKGEHDQLWQGRVQPQL